MKKLFLILTLIFTAFFVQAGLFDKKPTFLQADDAFPFSAKLSSDKSQLQVHWDITQGYYLYQDKVNGKFVSNAQKLSPHFQEKAETHQDPYFGEVQVFTPIHSIF